MTYLYGGLGNWPKRVGEYFTGLAASAEGASSQHLNSERSHLQALRDVAGGLDALYQSAGRGFGPGVDTDPDPLLLVGEATVALTHGGGRNLSEWQPTCIRTHRVISSLGQRAGERPDFRAAIMEVFAAELQGVRERRAHERAIHANLEEAVLAADERAARAEDGMRTTREALALANRELSEAKENLADLERVSNYQAQRLAAAANEPVPGDAVGDWPTVEQLERVGSADVQRVPLAPQGLYLEMHEGQPWYRGRVGRSDFAWIGPASDLTISQAVLALANIKSKEAVKS